VPGACVAALFIGAGAARASFPGLNGLIAVVGVDVMNPDGTGRVQLPRVPGAVGLPGAWSPNGRRLAFVAAPNGRHVIYVANADGSGRLPLTDSTSRASFEPSWSPDGMQIAYLDQKEYRNFGNRLMVMNADGSDKHMIKAFVASAQWSPVADEIAYSGYDEWGVLGVWISNSDGSNARRVTSGDDTDIRWSPDGTRLVFTRWMRPDTTDWRIYAVDTDGSDLTLLVQANYAIYANAWSPDGSTIVFYSVADGTLWKINPDGSDRRLLASKTSGAAWQRIPPPSDPPMFTRTPEIIGAPMPGSELTATAAARGDTPLSYAYQWTSCATGGGSCVDIASATSARFVPDSAYIGRTLRVRVTAHTETSAATMTSSATSPVSSGPAAVSVIDLGGDTASFSPPKITLPFGHSVRFTFAETNALTWRLANVRSAFMFDNIERLPGEAVPVTFEAAGTYTFGAGNENFEIRGTGRAVVPMVVAQ
jgi:plastocyanin